MKIILVALITATAISSCIVETSTSELVMVENTTDHLIKIIPFTMGVAYPQDVIVVQPHEQLIVGESTMRGKTKRPLLYTSYVRYKFEDSVYVVFDDTAVVRHYGAPPASPYGKYYLFSSNRNIRNQDSAYEVTYDEKKYVIGVTLTYRFTEDDYHFAVQ